MAPGGVNDGESPTAEREGDRLAGVPDLLEKTQAAGFEPGDLQCFHRVEAKWSLGLALFAVKGVAGDGIDADLVLGVGEIGVAVASGRALRVFSDVGSPSVLVPPRFGVLLSAVTVFATGNFSGSGRLEDERFASSGRKEGEAQLGIPSSKRWG
jgi:hypothetical protein